MPPHCIIFGVVLQEILFQPAVLYFNKILGLWLFNNDIWVILMSYNFNFLKILLSGFPIFQPPPPPTPNSSYTKYSQKIIFL